MTEWQRLYLRQKQLWQAPIGCFCIGLIAGTLAYVCAQP